MKRAATAVALSALFTQVACTDRASMAPPRSPTAAYPVSGITTPDGRYALPRCVVPGGSDARYFILPFNELGPFTYTNEPLPPNVMVVNVNSDLPEAPGAYIILPEWVNTLKREQTMVIAAHECAHQQLGHMDVTPENPKAYERQADCAGVSIMREQFHMTDEEITTGLSVLAGDIPFLKGQGGPAHDPFPVRHRLSLQCLARLNAAAPTAP